jgi:hypothetical protein
MYVQVCKIVLHVNLEMNFSVYVYGLRCAGKGQPANVSYWLSCMGPAGQYTFRLSVLHWLGGQRHQ